jgi:hypothetical protein
MRTIRTHRKPLVVCSTAPLTLLRRGSPNIVLSLVAALACSSPPPERAHVSHEARERTASIVDDAVRPENLSPDHQALLLVIQRRGGGGFEGIYEAAYLRRHLATHGYRGPQDLEQAVLKAREELARLQPNQTRLSGGTIDAINTALGLAGARHPVAGGAAKLLSALVSSLGKSADPKARVEALGRQGELFAGMQGFIDMYDASLLAMVEKHPELGFELDRLHFQPRFGVSVLDTIADLKRKDSGLADHLLTEALLSDIQQNVGATRERVEQLHGELKEMLAEASRAAHDAVVAQAHVDRMNAARAVVRGIGLLVAKNDPAAAAKIQFVGSALVTATDTFVRLKSTNEALKITNLAAATNLFSLAVTAFEVFGKQSGPDPWLVQELRAIHQAIQQGFAEMRASFEALNERLDELEAMIDDGFRRIQADIAVVRSEVEQVARAMVDLMDQIQGFESGLYVYLSAAFARDYVELVDLCRGYADRLGVGMSAERFATCESGLFVQTSAHAADAVLAGPDCSTIGLSDLAHTLGQNPPARNLRCLLTLLPRLGVTGLRLDGAANVRHLRLAGDNYAGMLFENPEHAERLDSRRLDQLVDAGLRLRNTIVHFTVTGSGEAAVPNLELWRKLFDYRSARRVELGEELAATERTLQSRMAERIQPLDLWGGVDMAPPVQPALTGMRRCSGGGPNLSVPRVPMSVIPPAVQLAAYLGDGLEVCFRDVRWGDVAFRNTYTCGTETYSRLNYTVEVRRGSQAVTRHTRVGPAFQSGWTCTCFSCSSFSGGFDAETTLSSNWSGSVKADFESGAWVESLADAEREAALEGARTYSREQLRSFQDQVYLGVVDEISKPTPVRDAIVTWMGANAILPNIVPIAMFDELRRSDELHAALFGGRVVDFGPNEVARVYADNVADAARAVTVRARDTLVRTMAEQALHQESVIEEAVTTRAEDAKVLPPPTPLDVTLGEVTARRSEYSPFQTSVGTSADAATQLLRVEFSQVTVSGATTITPTEPPVLGPRPDSLSIVRSYRLRSEARYQGAVVCVRTTRPPAPGERFVIVGEGSWDRLPTVSRPLMDPAWTCTEEFDTLPAHVGLAVARNQAPVAQCSDLARSVAEGGTVEVSPSDIAQESVDGDGDELTFTLAPSGPFPAGEHRVVATVSDGAARSSCAARIVVETRGEAGEAGAGAGGTSDGGDGDDDGGRSPGSSASGGSVATAGSGPVAGTGGGGGTPVQSPTPSPTVEVSPRVAFECSTSRAGSGPSGWPVLALFMAVSLAFRRRGARHE